MSEHGPAVREGFALKLTPEWGGFPEHVGWIPGPPWPTRERAEARRQEGGHPEWYEIVPAAMDEWGNVWEVEA